MRMLAQSYGTARVHKLKRHLSRIPTQPLGQATLIRKLTSASRKHYKYIIIGGGNASGYAAKQFVDLKGSPGDLAIFTEEAHAPYERPALSKAYLHPPNAKFRAKVENVYTCVGGGSEKQPPEWYAQNGVDLFTKSTVTNIDNIKKVVNVATGEQYSYDKLLFATGARAIGLDEIGVKGANLENVLSLRSAADATKLVATLEGFKGKPEPAVIIGGGYIGMETAAALSGWGLAVTMVFPEDQLMQRLFPKAVADWFESEFAKRGITMLKKTTVTELIGGTGGKVAQAVLSNGKVLDASIVIAGIGARPNSDLLKGKVEIATDGGIKVDSKFQSSDASISAFGDVASFPHSYMNGKNVRFEHVSNCRQSAAHVMKNVLGTDAGDYSYFPYFYSRLFEYTESPLIFQFYGYQTQADASQSLETVSFSDAKRVGAVWCDPSKTVLGAMLVNGTDENWKELPQLVKSKPTLKGDATELFSSW